ncbi:hypothetical protein DKX38_029235 [Salix brachista]|uniref:Uncharacterized protein n=1 Tax=Salix brachista TaxID=2182728 RepID=A0A5N5JAW8_9ROSI|nr:hypothetical protein DKX38_029235 [Salix brachista]
MAGNSCMAHHKVRLPACTLQATPTLVSSPTPTKQDNLIITMEALKMRIFLAIMAALMAVSSLQNVAAADAPAPSPTSGATATFAPAALASLAALAFGLLF